MPKQISQDWSRTSTRPLYINLNMYLDGAWTHITTYSYVQSIAITMATNTAFSGTLSLFDHYGDLLTNNLLGPALLIPMQLTFGWADDKNPSEIPTYNGTIIRGTGQFTRTGTRGFLEFIANYSSQAILDKTAGPRVFAAGLTASAIVQQIATAFGWTNAIIETSYDPLQEFNLGDQSIYEFLTQTLTPYARNSKNEQFVWYFDAAGIFHFHSPRYQALQTNPTNGYYPQLAWKYLATADYTGDCISFTPTDNIIQAGQAGGQDATIVSINSDTGQVQEFKTQAEGGPNLNDGSSANTAGVRFTPHEDVVSNTRYNNQPNDQAYLTSSARNGAESTARLPHYHMNARYSQYAEMQAMGTHRVKVLDFISVRAINFQGYDQYTSGVFQTYVVTHSLDRTGWKTNFTLRRLGQPEIVGGTSQIPVTAVSTLSDPGTLLLGPASEIYGN